MTMHIFHLLFFWRALRSRTGDSKTNVRVSTKLIFQRPYLRDERLVLRSQVVDLRERVADVAGDDVDGLLDTTT